MLIVRCKKFEWVEVTHKSGDVLRIRLQRSQHSDTPDIVFDDNDRNFEIRRTRDTTFIEPSLDKPKQIV